MALFEMHYKSEALKSNVTVNVILPEYPKNEERGLKCALSVARTFGGLL